MWTPCLGHAAVRQGAKMSPGAEVWRLSPKASGQQVIGDAAGGRQGATNDRHLRVGSSQTGSKRRIPCGKSGDPCCRNDRMIPRGKGKAERKRIGKWEMSSRVRGQHGPYVCNLILVQDAGYECNTGSADVLYLCCLWIHGREGGTGLGPKPLSWFSLQAMGAINRSLGLQRSSP